MLHGLHVNRPPHFHATPFDECFCSTCVVRGEVTGSSHGEVGTELIHKVRLQKEHTALLLKCYTKMNDKERLQESVNLSAEFRSSYLNDISLLWKFIFE